MNEPWIGIGQSEGDGHEVIILVEVELKIEGVIKNLLIIFEVIKVGLGIFYLIAASEPAGASSF